MNNKINQKHCLTVALLAIAFIGCITAGMIDADDSSAIGEDLSGTYGSPSNINLSPGYSWTYTTSYPSDVSSYVTTSLQVNDGAVATVSGNTVQVTIPSTATAGTVYNVVIKASMSSPVSQTAYQYITFTIVSGLTVPSNQAVNSIVLGTGLTFAAQASAGLGTLTWSVTSGHSLPDGLSLASDGTVSGTPAAAGTYTLYLTVSNGYQTADLVTDFTVYNSLIFTSSPTNGVIAYAV